MVKVATVHAVEAPLEVYEPVVAIHWSDIVSNRAAVANMRLLAEKKTHCNAPWFCATKRTGLCHEDNVGDK
jgi:hypothetical protein